MGLEIEGSTTIGRREREQVIDHPENLSRLDWVKILRDIYYTSLKKTPVVVPGPESDNEFVLAVRQPGWGLVVVILDQMENEFGFWKRPYAIKLKSVDDDLVGPDRVMGFFGVRRSTPDPLDNRLARQRPNFF